MYCSQCGVTVSDEARFCFHCGSSLHKGVAEAEKPMPVEPPPPLSVGPAAPEAIPAEDRDPGDWLAAIVKSEIGFSAWWLILAASAFWAFGAIIQSARTLGSSPIHERVEIGLGVAVFYTAITSFFLVRSKKRTLLTPWEVEARLITANLQLFIAVSMSCAISLFQAIRGTEEPTVQLIIVAFIGIVFGAGWAAWRGNRWAVIALFVWVFASALFGDGYMEPLGLFIVVLCVIAYRYHHAAQRFAELGVPDLLTWYYGLTKLSYAAARGNIYYVRYLLRSGVDVNGRTATGYTPLILAAASNLKPDVVKHLLKSGADKSIAAPDGRTAADFARDRGATEIEALLA